MTQIPEQNDPSRTEACSQSQQAPKSMPDRLGSFRIESVIGTGGMGTVYRAYDESMRRHVALKVLHPSFGLSEVAQQRFARESWIAGQLEHPNIIRVYTRGDEGTLQYFAMELADGGSLAEHVKKLRSEANSSDVGRTVDSAHVRFLLERFIMVAEALEVIHSKGFIHRDIKPHNLLLCREQQQFKLTDFGIAHANEMTRVTRAGDFIGTIKYMSPELLAAHRAGVDKRTDIYSLGVTLYEALTLSLPYDADTEERYISEILAGRIVPARRRNRRLPVDVETILLKATDHDPQRRYQSAHEFAEDLRAILEDRPVHAKRPGIIRRVGKLVKRHRAATLFAAVVLIVAGAGAQWFYQTETVAGERRHVLRILRAAVEARRTPQDLEPNWSALAGRVVEAVADGTDDSLAYWFHRASGTLQVEEAQLDNKLTILLKHLNVLPDQTRTIPDVFVLITDIDISADTASLAPFLSGWTYYSLTSLSGGFGVDIPLDSLFAYSPGLHNIEFRLISRHYKGSKLFVPRDDSSGMVADDLSPAQIKEAILAGTLVAQDAHTETMSRARGKVVVLSDVDSTRAEPFVQDTAFERLSVMVSGR